MLSLICLSFIHKNKIDIDKYWNYDVSYNPNMTDPGASIYIPHKYKIYKKIGILSIFSIISFASAAIDGLIVLSLLKMIF